MPPLPGEERALTLFADVHYYFSPPSPRPLLHRFDKGSYLYIYHDAAQRKARIEIANNPGFPEQDAFAGSLGTALLRNSDTFPTLFTLTVNAQRPSISGELPNQAEHEWSLASGHPQDTSGALHQLHTLDIYFWTTEDARLFLSTVQRILQPTQLDIIATQPAMHAAPVSTVVQQLEQVAISNPGYHNNYAGEISPTGSANLPPPPAGGPPKQPTAISQPSMGSAKPLDRPEGQPPTQAQEEKAELYTPLAYNPAAPAAPEPIKHREKTPPPSDSASGTGLAAAAAKEQGMPFTQSASIGLSQGSHNQMQGYNQQTSVSSPPPHGGSLSFGPTAGPPSTGHSATLSYPPHPPAQEPTTGVYRQQSFGPPPGGEYNQFQQQQQPAVTAYNQQQPYGQPYQPQASQPQPPLGGYSDYSYSQTQRPMANQYDVHNQVYRPTEGEHTYHQRHGSGSLAPSGDRKPSKIAENAMRVEKGVNRLFKKLEKKL
ncbi:predicted protein [Uncinocarpus reesii 1704]|uniref:RNA recognition motif-containing protein n=1 Tax=Uncinocarpus reesii (strain UAMH 1704) TaxID=336963 RepID=C4JF92_UNCRE|nr:uncharacterized protein UREG_02314 [Uncinocarpus reesii 1704]EEP77465.1 predicted protein [Uncinocarpus reesii 1704]